MNVSDANASDTEPRDPTGDLTYHDLLLISNVCLQNSLSPQVAFEALLEEAPDLAPNRGLGFSTFRDIFYSICCYEKESSDYRSPLKQAVLDRVTGVRDFIMEAFPDEPYQDTEEVLKLEEECNLEDFLQEVDDGIQMDEFGVSEPSGLWVSHDDVEILDVKPSRTPLTSPLADASQESKPSTKEVIDLSGSEETQDETLDPDEDMLLLGGDTEDVLDAPESCLLEESESQEVIPSKIYKWPSVTAYQVIKWGFFACAAYRSLSGQMDTLLVPGLVGPLLAAYLAHILKTQPLNSRYNFVLFVYGVFGCLAAYCMPGYRGIAWVVPCILSVINPFTLLCRRKGWTVQGTLCYIQKCILAGLRLIGVAYYPVMTVAYNGLAVFVVALALTEVAQLVRMLRSDEAVDMEIGQEGLQLAMLAVLIALVQSLKETLAKRRALWQSSVAEEDTAEMPQGDEDEEDNPTALSFVWLNLVVCAVLGTIAVNGSVTGSLSHAQVLPLVQGLGVICAGNAFVVKTGELFPALHEIF